jgi:hypothetical protein
MRGRIDLLECVNERGCAVFEFHRKSYQRDLFARESREWTGIIFYWNSFGVIRVIRGQTLSGEIDASRGSAKKFPEKSVDIFSRVLIKSKLLRKMPGKNKGNKQSVDAFPAFSLETVFHTSDPSTS